MPCNTSDKNEFSAVPYEKGLLFCSDRSDPSAIKFETTKGAKPLVNVFFAANDSSTKAVSAAAFSSIYAHDGPVAFYDNGNRAVLTRTQSDKNKFKSLYKDTKLGLFFFEKKEGKWRETGSFPFNDQSYSCGQATINNDGTVMVFSSDMPGSNGGTDLYYSTFNPDDSSWILPVNLGPVINSSKNEMFPFLHPSGILYFSSSGKKGKGGLDVFHTVGGYPYSRIVHEVDEINSEQDDFGFWASADFSKGYLTSNRAGTDDVYSVSLTPPEFQDCVEYQDVSYCYEFFEEASIDVDTIPMVYEWDFGDGIRKKGLSAYHCYKEPGIYTVQLNVFDTVVNALFMNEATYELEIADKNQPLMQVPDSANPNKPFFVSAGQARFKDFIIGGYYWDFGDGIHMKGERFPVTLEKVGTYDVVLGVTSIPDKNGRTQSKCFKKRLVVCNDSIPPQLVDDSSDPAVEKLPGGTQGTTYVLVEESEGFHVTRLKGDGTNTSDINHLPNSIYYLKIGENGDTLVKKHSNDPESRKLLETYLDQAESPYEQRKNGLVSYNAFLPSDSTKYPVYAMDIKKFYGSIDSLVKSPWQFTLLPSNIANALMEMNSDEAGLSLVRNNDKKYLPQYNANVNVPNDSTTVFHKQVSTDPKQSDLTNTTQYDTQKHIDKTNNLNTNNVINNNVQNNANNQAVDSTKQVANNTNNNTNNNAQNKLNNQVVDSTKQVANSTNNNTNNNAQNNLNNQTVDSTKQVANNTNNNAQNNLNNQTVDSTKQVANNTNNNTNNNAQNKLNNQVVDSTNQVTNNTNNNTNNNAQNKLNNQAIDSTKQVANNTNNNTNNNAQNNLNNQTVDSTKQVANNTNNNTNNNAQNNLNNLNVDSTKSDNSNNNVVIDNNQQNKLNALPADSVKKLDDLKDLNNLQIVTLVDKHNDSIRPALDTIDIVIDDMLRFTHPDLEYKVQIGAYRHPENFKYQYLKKLGKKDELLVLDGITRITLGRFKTMKEAYEFRDRVRKAGVSDAFVTAVFNGKRYYLFELKEILKELIPKTTN